MDHPQTIEATPEAESVRSLLTAERLAEAERLWLEKQTAYVNHAYRSRLMLAYYQLCNGAPHEAIRMEHGRYIHEDAVRLRSQIISSVEQAERGRKSFTGSLREALSGQERVNA